MADPNHHSSGAGLTRRPVALSKPRSGPGGLLRPDIDPPPKPRLSLQYVAFGLIFVLACLQFLPATHFRDPADPHRSWIAFDPKSSTPITIPRTSETEEAIVAEEHGPEIEPVHIYSWTDCLDLRVFTVFANSTLSNSRDQENIYFHFFIPEDEDYKLSYYKMKVLLPHSHLETIGQKEVKKKLTTILPGRELHGSLLHDIAPLVIPIISSLSKKFIYVSPNTIIKGNIEELLGVDLGPYAIAAVEDCSRRIGDYVRGDVLDAIQRTAAKTWVSDKPYDKNACLPDLNVLLFDPTKIKTDTVDAILWWSKVLNLGSERDQLDPAIALAIYEKYLKLPNSWKICSTSHEGDSESKLLLFDGPTRMCSKMKDKHQESNHGKIWQNYLPPNSEAILSHQS